jgi:enoyl-CoA hydratase/carnithine racemase
MMQTVTALPQPVIARVQGARGGGRLPARRPMRPRGRVGVAQVHHAGRHLGILLLHARGRGRPQHLAQARNGDASHRRCIDAHKALEWGLVNRVCLLTNWNAKPCSLPGKSPRSRPRRPRAGKRAFYQQMDLGVARAYDLASQVISSSFAHAEGREGMDAFIDKRAPPKLEWLYHPPLARGGWPTKRFSKRAG